MPRKDSEELIEQVVPEVLLKKDVPIIRARVVYLGANRKESVALPGSVLVEHFEEPGGPAEWIDREGKKRQGIEIRKCVTGGIQSYDFSTHDLKGLLIRERLLPDSAPERLRGKPYCWVEHPSHLVEFHMGPKDRDGKRRKGEFEVMVKPEDLPALQEYLQRAMRRERRQLQELEEVIR